MTIASGNPGSQIVLVDVGGLGGIQSHWDRFRPMITPIVFEPNPPEAAAIRLAIEAAGGRVVERALGSSAGAETLRVAKSLGCTSLLEPNTALLAKYSIAPAFATTHTLSIDCVRYDALHAAGEVPAPDVIKIDVQGFEFNVLSGFGDLLHGCLGIQIEAHLYPIYHGQKLLGDLVQLVAPFGLALRKLSPVEHFDGDIVEVDAWFTCDAERAGRLTENQLAKLQVIEEAWELPARRKSFGLDQFADAAE